MSITHYLLVLPRMFQRKVSCTDCGILEQWNRCCSSTGPGQPWWGWACVHSPVYVDGAKCGAQVWQTVGVCMQYAKPTGSRQVACGVSCDTTRQYYRWKVARKCGHNQAEDRRAAKSPIKYFFLWVSWCTGNFRKFTELVKWTRPLQHISHHYQLRWIQMVLFFSRCTECTWQSEGS